MSLSDFATDHDLDLGHSHYLRFTQNGKGERIGAIIAHPAGPHPIEGAFEPGRCGGSVYFDVPAAHAFSSSGAFWKVVSEDPLTLTPSVACSCGDHGFITDGRWVSA